MISITLPSKRKSFTSTTTTPSIVSHMFNRAKDRDAAIRKLVAACPYQSGDLCKITEPKDVAKYGEEIEIIKICDSYAKFGKSMSWPEDDNPMIVDAWSPVLNGMFTCTTNYLAPIYTDATCTTIKKAKS